MGTDCEEAERDRAGDGLEKFVMTKLHDRVFAYGDEEASEPGAGRGDLLS